MAVKKNVTRKKQQEKKGSAPARPKVTLPSFRFSLDFLSSRKFKVAVGIFAMLLSVFLLISVISFIFTGRGDQSVIETMNIRNMISSGKEIKNWLGLFGGLIAHFFIYHLFGLSSILFVPLLFWVGSSIVYDRPLYLLRNKVITAVFAMLWFSTALGYYVDATGEYSNWGFLCGGAGLRIAEVLSGFAGWGAILILLFVAVVFAIFQYQEAFGQIEAKLQQSKENAEATKPDEPAEVKPALKVPAGKSSEPIELAPQPSTASGETKKRFGNLWKVGGLPVEKEAEPLSGENQEQDVHEEVTIRPAENIPLKVQYPTPPAVQPPLPFHEEDMPDPAKMVISEEDLYDPRLDLYGYKFPTAELLNDVGSNKVKVTREELEENKDRIVETLSHFKIGISSIKATIGPTVTLYEIVPEAGIKISRIKNLEDDIALSLAALGIRIIAPIPGKGTIGIEVPNKNREMVSIRSVLTSEKFTNSDKELPVALGKTISNEVFVTDLTKMPHLLMAGATGQGKSVGLNVLLTSLLYKKHPSELKLVLIDPKKVELSLFNHIERHFLAMLPDAEDAIITDVRQVVNVLNSLCVEMDQRYSLLKEAGCRNIKEYNGKFVRRRLNPEKGHRFLPYIVLVIDELADLMMTAGKEVELPVARLAQLARAIGIHLIIATQRPSVDVITGVIKANFPARLSFRVSSKVDSRTILDTGGADQLIGMGDMLLSNGSEIIRLQCAFVDTDEVERVCDYIGSQRGFETAYLLPEISSDDDEDRSVDLSDRDDMFEAAARLLVAHQHGSTSLIQRKLSLGYNRAGRIIDQLEAAGVVGPFEGSKARQVLIRDEETLEQLLNSLR